METTTVSSSILAVCSGTQEIENQESGRWGPTWLGREMQTQIWAARLVVCPSSQIFLGHALWLVSISNGNPATGTWTPNFIFADLDPDNEAPVNISGFQVTGGYFVSDSVQLLARFDRLDADDLDFNSDLLLLAANWWPSGATEIQVNLVIPTRDFELGGNQLLINYQLVF